MPTPAKEFKINKFLGINNVDPPEKCKPGELQEAINVDIDDSFRVARRNGYDRKLFASVHSLWSDGKICLFRTGTDLKRLSTTYSAETIRTGISNNTTMRYLSLNGRVYYSDEYITGIYDGTTDRTWGLSLPGSFIPTAVGGNMPEGDYLYCFTFVRNDWQESGSGPISKISVPEGSGLNFASIPSSSDTTVSYVNLYLSTTDGEVLYLASTVPNGTISIFYDGDTKSLDLPLATKFLSPPPAGQNIQFYNGRVYIAQGSYLWYTEPFSYELINLAHNHISFNSRISLMAPVRDGIWVSTQENTVFLSGPDPVTGGFKSIEKMDYPAIEGTQQKMQDIGAGKEEIFAWIWASTDGVIVGTDEGKFKNTTSVKYSIPESTRGASLVRDSDTMSQFVISLI